jgi:hypothetical protein
MDYVTLTGLACALGLLLGIVLLVEVGRRMGLRHRLEDPEAATTNVGPMDGAVFGLMGLLVAFTFSGAAARFDARRNMIVEETNDIGTAYLRLDLLPAASQPTLRDAFRRYVDSRLEVYRKLPDVAAAYRELADSNRLQKTIWAKAVEACQEADSAATTTLVLGALNDMIDITTTRTMTAQMHVPSAVVLMLFVVMLASALLAGYGMGSSSNKRRLLHICAFAMVTSLAVYVIIDIEMPRLGLIRIDAFDSALVDLRASMND